MMITINVPPVRGCSAQECAYNVKKQCHAKAITIGDADFPACDSMFLPEDANHVHSKEQAGVGACKVSACTFNEDLLCTADGIKVGVNEGNVECLTFRP